MANVALLKRRRVLGDRCCLVGAALLSSGCSLLIETGRATGENDASAMATSNGGSSGSGPSQPLGGSPSLAIGEGGAGTGEPPSAIGEFAPAGAGPLGAAGARVSPSAGADAGDAATPRLDGNTEPPNRSSLHLAFLEASANGTASLRLVNARDALSSSEPADAEPSWRRTLRPRAQAGSALDFAWSPDGQRIALRYESLDSRPQIAFFEAPEWQELSVEELELPASQPILTAAANYRWSPDSRSLAVELTGAQGQFVGGYLLRDASAIAVPSVAFSGAVESMAWLSPTQLFVAQLASGERGIVTLGLNQGVFEPALLDTSRLVVPLALRQIPAGIAGASVEQDSFLYFWPTTREAASEAVYTGFSYVSAGQAFVAETDAELAEAYLYPMGEFLEPLDTLPDCPVVLTWAEGPLSGSLAGSKLACLVVRDAVATISVYSFAADGARTATTLDDETVRTDFASTTTWEGHARSFSPVTGWLALATADHDILVDLRAPIPKYKIETAASASTARSFSPSGGHLLEQRGQALHFTLLAPPNAGVPVSFAILDASEAPPPCDTAEHMPNWCGAPLAAAAASARWAARDDVAVWLTRDEGLNLTSFNDERSGPLYRTVSTCGAACVTQYALAP